MPYHWWYALTHLRVLIPTVLMATPCTKSPNIQKIKIQIDIDRKIKKGINKIEEEYNIQEVQTIKKSIIYTSTKKKKQNKITRKRNKTNYEI